MVDSQSKETLSVTLASGRVIPRAAAVTHAPPHTLRSPGPGAATAGPSGAAAARAKLRHTPEWPPEGKNAPAFPRWRFGRRGTSPRPEQLRIGTRPTRYERSTGNTQDRA